MTRAPAALILALWIAGLAGLGVFVQRALTIDSDLRLFLPTAETPEERLLLAGIGEGPASRVLVVALEGGSAQELADASRALAAALDQSAAFRSVANGELALESFPDELLPYRFLLSPSFDARGLDAELLHAELEARARDLASPFGLLIEPWLARDPTLELMKLAERWQPLEEPQLDFDVWFDRAGERALLIAETHAAAFDPSRQRDAIDELERTFGDLDERGDLTLTVSGTGRFSAEMEARTRAEAERISRAATIGMVVLLLVAYRRIGSLLLTLLPLASAGLAGLAAVGALFGSVHGITLAFGFTLIGVAQDYPIHLLSHGRSSISARGRAQRPGSALRYRQPSTSRRGRGLSRRSTAGTPASRKRRSVRTRPCSKAAAATAPRSRLPLLRSTSTVSSSTRFDNTTSAGRRCASRSKTASRQRSHSR
jgi:predicted exporter